MEIEIGNEKRPGGGGENEMGREREREDPHISQNICCCLFNINTRSTMCLGGCKKREKGGEGGK